MTKIIIELVIKMTAGRPKSEHPKDKILTIRLTQEEFQEICKVAEKNKITKTEAILRGIKNLSQVQPVYYRSQMPNFKPKKIPKHSEGIIPED